MTIEDVVLRKFLQYFHAGKTEWDFMDFTDNGEMTVLALTS